MDLEEFRVFKVDGGEAERIITSYFDALGEYYQYLKDMFGGYGKIRCFTTNHFAGVVASKNPDPRLFRKGKDIYLLRHNNAAKPITAAIEAYYPAINRWALVGKLVKNLKQTIKVVNGKAYLQQADFWGKPGAYFVCVPKEAEGFEVIDGLCEIPLSEYYAIIESQEGK